MNTHQRQMLISRLSAITPSAPADPLPQMLAVRGALEGTVASMKARESQLQSQIEIVANERARIEQILSTLVAKIDHRQRGTVAASGVVTRPLASSRKRGTSK